MHRRKSELKGWWRAVVCLCAGAALTANAAESTTLALVGGNVVDVERGELVRDAVLLVQGDKIAAVGRAGEVNVPADARRIDVHGKYLMPGLINTHVHLGLKLPGAAGAMLANETSAELALRMASNARRSLEVGVTTLRLTGERGGVDFALKRAIERGEIVGPRIESAGEIISTTGGHGSAQADGPYALAQLARLQIKNGATWIKIATSGGIADSHGEIAAAPMTDDELRILVEAARRNGVDVTSHNGSPEAAKQCIAAGVKGFEHGYFLTRENLLEMKKHDMWLVPTIVVSEAGAQEFFKRIGSPDWYLKRVETVGKSHWAMLQQAISIGVNIALGTDQMPYEPNSGTTATVHEAELYVKAGMTPARALRAATFDAARMLKLETQVGTLRPGAYADVIAVRENPLADVSALRNIDMVMKGGTVIR